MTCTRAEIFTRIKIKIDTHHLGVVFDVCVCGENTYISNPRRNIIRVYCLTVKLLPEESRNSYYNK